MATKRKRLDSASPPPSRGRAGPSAAHSSAAVGIASGSCPARTAFQQALEAQALLSKMHPRLPSSPDVDRDMAEVALVDSDVEMASVFSRSPSLNLSLSEGVGGGTGKGKGKGRAWGTDLDEHWMDISEEESTDDEEVFGELAVDADDEMTDVEEEEDDAIVVSKSLEFIPSESSSPMSTPSPSPLAKRSIKKARPDEEEAAERDPANELGPQDRDQKEAPSGHITLPKAKKHARAAADPGTDHSPPKGRGAGQHKGPLVRKRAASSRTRHGAIEAAQRRQKRHADRAQHRHEAYTYADPFAVSTQTQTQARPFLPLAFKLLSPIKLRGPEVVPVRPKLDPAARLARYLNRPAFVAFLAINVQTGLADPMARRRRPLRSTSIMCGQLFIAYFRTQTEKRRERVQAMLDFNRRTEPHVLRKWYQSWWGHDRAEQAKAACWFVQRPTSPRPGPSAAVALPARASAGVTDAASRSSRLASPVASEAPISRPPSSATSTSSYVSSTSSLGSPVASIFSDPPDYEGLGYPVRLAIRPPPSRIVSRPAPLPVLPPYAPNRYRPSSPSPPPPYNARTDRETIQLPLFANQEEEVEAVLSDDEAIAMVGAWPTSSSSARGEVQVHSRSQSQSRVRPGTAQNSGARIIAPRPMRLSTLVGNPFDMAVDLEEGEEDMVEAEAMPEPGASGTVLATLGGWFSRFLG